MDIYQPLVSIVVPVYNTELYVKECLTSIVQQSYRNIEIIIIDDGSSDKSGYICDEFANRYKNIFVFHRDNHGVSDARNFAIDVANGEYLIFVDSDDYIAQNMCEKLISIVNAYNIDFVICGNYNVSTIGTRKRNIFSKSCKFQGEAFNREICEATLGLIGEKLRTPNKLDRLTPIWARLYKTEIIKKNNIKFIDLYKLPSECLQFNYEYCMYAESGYYLNEPLYYYRRNTQMSVTKPFRHDLWDKWHWWIQYMDKFLKEHHASSYHWDAYYSRICHSVIPLGGNALKLNSFNEQIKEIKLFLNQPIYTIAFKKINVSLMPAHWRMFFCVARNKRIYLFFLMTWCMRKILMLKKS